MNDDSFKTEGPRVRLKPDPIIFALHGFLGLGTDWNFLKEDYELIAPSYLSFNSPFPPEELKPWANKIAGYVFKNIPTSRIFLGYSLGARLGLYLAKYHNTLFEKYIFVAPHLGDLDERERVSRIRNDAEWAKRFEADLWDEVVSDWNAQSVFESSKSLSKRDENFFSRKYLSGALSHGSVALSEDFSKHTIINAKNIYYFVGKADQKYKDLYLKWNPFNLRVIEAAGHRVPWDSPLDFIRELRLCIQS